MTPPEASTASDAEFPCRECRTQLPAGARKCTKCSSFQDWRRGIFAWSGVFTATLALLPLWTGAFSLWNLAFARPAHIEAAIATCRSDKVMAYLHNDGQETAMLAEPTVDFRDGEAWTRFDATFAVAESKLVVKPDEVQMLNLAVPDEGTFPPNGDKPCHLKVMVPVLSGRGEQSVAEATCRCSDK